MGVLSSGETGPGACRAEQHVQHDTPQCMNEWWAKFRDECPACGLFGACVIASRGMMCCMRPVGAHIVTLRWQNSVCAMPYIVLVHHAHEP
jgi:hypothetical protein